MLSIRDKIIKRGCFVVLWFCLLVFVLGGRKVIHQRVGGHEHTRCYQGGGKSQRLL